MEETVKETAVGGTRHGREGLPSCSPEDGLAHAHSGETPGRGQRPPNPEVRLESWVGLRSEAKVSDAQGLFPAGFQGATEGCPPEEGVDPGRLGIREQMGPRRQVQLPDRCPQRLEGSPLGAWPCPRPQSQWRVCWGRE